jgi:hypothetical protein
MLKKSFTLGLGSLVCLVLIFAACSETPSDPEPAGQITIANIPQQIGSKDTYKIYVSLSDYMTDDQLHTAQGTKVLAASDFVNGKANVTIDLYKPSGTDRDLDEQQGGKWSGNAKFFSVIISPQTVFGSADIQAKAGSSGFSDSKKEFDWSSLMDMSSMTDNINAIYTRIICKDGPLGGSGIIVVPKGTWKDAEGTVNFTINENLTFTCDLNNKMSISGKVTGKLSKSDIDLAANEYIMEALQSTAPPLGSMLPGFNGTKIALTLSKGGNEFEFSSDEPAVKGFFGGTFTKVPN